VFNKVRCSKCKYHTLLSGGGASEVIRSDSKFIACFYDGWSKAEGNMVIKNGKVYDRRGSDSENCQLYEENQLGID
jgi:hypothetical protein